MSIGGNFNYLISIKTHFHVAISYNYVDFMIFVYPIFAV